MRETLICASARAEIVIKCIREFSLQGKVTVIAPSSVYDGLAAFKNDENVKIVRLSTDKMCIRDRGMRLPQLQLAYKLANFFNTSIEDIFFTP